MDSIKHTNGIAGIHWYRMAGLLVLLMLVQSCGWMHEKNLRQRAESYYEAMLYNDFEMLYDYQCREFKGRAGRSDFIRFMKEEDPRADFDEFEIDSVVVDDARGRVRLKFKGSFLFYEDSRNVTSTWVLEEGKWRVDKDPRGRFWQRFCGWKASQRLRRLPRLRLQMEPVADAIESYRRHHGVYPPDLRALKGNVPIADPHSKDGTAFRYFAQGRDFWILAACGPDGRPDIDVGLYRGDLAEYPPLELVYDPMTSRGDLYIHGPDYQRNRLRSR